MARKKPCEFCEAERLIQTDADARNVSGSIEIYPEQNFFSVWFQGKSDDGGLTHEESFDIPMNYCPNCGRKLGCSVKRNSLGFWELGDRKLDRFCGGEIFYIEDVNGYYMINGADGYKKSDWTIEEAVADYRSDEGRNQRFESWYRAWCD